MGGGDLLKKIVEGWSLWSEEAGCEHTVRSESSTSLHHKTEDGFDCKRAGAHVKAVSISDVHLKGVAAIQLLHTVTNEPRNTLQLFCGHSATAVALAGIRLHLPLSYNICHKKTKPRGTSPPSHTAYFKQKNTRWKAFCRSSFGKHGGTMERKKGS